MNYVKKSTLPLQKTSIAIRRNYVIGAISILLALSAFERWTLFNSISSDPVDGSWSIALNIINQLNLQYGNEVVFTYGPLGYLGSTRLPIAINKWQILLYDLWLILQGALVIWIILRNKFSIQNVVAILLVTSILYSGAGGDPPFLYFYFVLFFLCYHLQTKKNLWLVNAMTIAVFTFFVKGNVGLICLGCFLFYITYYCIRSKLSVQWYVTYLALTTISVLAGAFAFNVDLYRYLIGNLQIIDSYNDVMRYYDDNGERILLVAGLILGLYGLSLVHTGWAYRKEINHKSTDSYIPVLFSVLALFILFKEGFVRADTGHNCLFFKYAFLPLSLLTVFIPKPVLQRDMGLVAMVVLVVQLLLLKPSFYFNHPKQLAHYVTDVINPSYSTPDSIRRFPAHWRNHLRRGTVDVVPNDVASVYLNGLAHAYRPRPVFQSYQVTNHFLDSLNATFYQSPRAPEYILYTHNAIDNRYPFSDEIGTRLTMLRYYDLFDKGTKDWMMLKRRATPYRLDTLSVRSEGSQLQTDIMVPATSTVQLMQIQVEHSLPGKITRLLFQPPTLELELETADGKWHNYQASTTMLANGFVANRWVSDNPAFQEYMCSKGQTGLPVRRIRVTTPRWSWATQAAIHITRTELSYQ